MPIITKESSWVRADVTRSKTEGEMTFLESLMPIYDWPRYRTNFTVELPKSSGSDRRELNFTTLHRYLGVEPRIRQSVDLGFIKYKLLGRWTIHSSYSFPFKNCFI